MVDAQAPRGAGLSRHRGRADRRGRQNLHGDDELDAGGHVVAPGFIDIHTHYDAQVFWDPAMTPSCFHGVTTVVAGKCGFSSPRRGRRRELVGNTLQKVEDMDRASLMAGIPWDFETFPEYLASVERRGTVLNYSAFVGHTPLRFLRHGPRGLGPGGVRPRRSPAWPASSARRWTPGAAGVATSFAITHLGADGRPIPSRLAQKDELARHLRRRRRERTRRRRHQRRQGPHPARRVRHAAGHGRPRHLHRAAHHGRRLPPQGPRHPPCRAHEGGRCLAPGLVSPPLRSRC